MENKGIEISPTGWSTLHYAVVHGDVDKVKELVETGTNVNARGNDGETTLHVSARGNKEISALLS